MIGGKDGENTDIDNLGIYVAGGRCAILGGSVTAKANGSAEIRAYGIFCDITNTTSTPFTGFLTIKNATVNALGASSIHARWTLQDDTIGYTLNGGALAAGGDNPFRDVAEGDYYRALGKGQRRDQGHLRRCLQPQGDLHPEPDRDLPLPPAGEVSGGAIEPPNDQHK